MGLFKRIISTMGNDAPRTDVEQKVEIPFCSLFDNKHRSLADEYFPGMEKIQEDWSIMYNLKSYNGKRADRFAEDCKKNIELYKKMAKIERAYDEIPPPSVPAYKRLAMLYEKQGLFEDSASVCMEALRNGVTGDGMRSRLARMIKKIGRKPTQDELFMIDMEKE